MGNILHAMLKWSSVVNSDHFPNDGEPRSIFLQAIGPYRWSYGIVMWYDGVISGNMQTPYAVKWCTHYSCKRMLAPGGGKSTRCFIRNHFVRSLHVEGQKIYGTCATKDKISKEFFSFEYLYQCKQLRIKKPDTFIAVEFFPFEGFFLLQHGKKRPKNKALCKNSNSIRC